MSDTTEEPRDLYAYLEKENAKLEAMIDEYLDRVAKEFPEWFPKGQAF